jgi:hypothetical protein
VALFLIANFVIVHAVVILVLRTPVVDTGVLPIAWFFEGRQGRDSWDSMALGYLHAAAPHRTERPFYWRTFFNPQILHKGFQYPPTALLVASALQAVLGARWPAALGWITWAMIPVTAVLLWKLYEALAARAGLPIGPRPLVALTAVFATLTFYPVMRAYANGQIQAWLNAAFIVAVLGWATKRPRVSGASIALSCAIKPQLGLFVAWGALRRQWPFVMAWGAVAAALLLASIALYGWEPHAAYLGVLRFLAQRGEAFYPNQSVNGLLNRWLGNGDVLSWHGSWIEHFPPYDARVFGATVATSAALVVIGLAGPRGERGGVIDFCLMGLVATVASPIAWEHHYGVLLPMFAVAFTTLARARAPRRWWVALATSYILASNCFWVTKRFAGSRLGVLESYLFFGAVMLLILLLKLPMLANASPATEEAVTTPARR